MNIHDQSIGELLYNLTINNDTNSLAKLLNWDLGKLNVKLTTAINNKLITDDYKLTEEGSLIVKLYVEEMFKRK